MKKFLSLLLAALLCVGCMTPVMAEAGDSLSSLFSTSTNTTAEAFPYTLSDYQVYFNLLCSNVLNVEAVWTVNGNTATADIAQYGTVVVETNADGYVTRLSTKMTIDLSNTDAASNMGMTVALVAMTSKATEDISFLSESSDAYTEQLLNILYSLMERIDEAMTKTITATGDVYGDTATFNMSISISDMTMTLEFIYEP